MIPDPERKWPWRWLLPLARRIDRALGPLWDLVRFGSPQPVEPTPVDRSLKVYRLDDEGEAIEVPGISSAAVKLAPPVDEDPPEAEAFRELLDGHVEIELKPAPRPLIHWAPAGHRFTNCCGRLVDSINPPDECHTGPTAATCNGGREPW